MDSLHEHIKGKTHIIWDWNGTLLADIDHAVKTVNRILEEEKLPLTTVESYKSIFGFPVIEYYKKLGLPTEPNYFLGLCDRFNQYFHEELHKLELHPGARNILASIKAAGKTQSLLSASEHHRLLECVRTFKVESFFDHVYGIFDKTAASKVERGLELIRTTNTPKHKTVLIGDTDHDLEVGQAMGIEVILVEHGHQNPNRLRGVHKNVVKVL
ncbi:MAG: HAD hydrolase-like protein [Bdellovibrionales bacterium]|nr:HAD hydrolase-like protein [Bdellovibrionales bacterium]